MSKFYDRSGAEISIEEWSALVSDPETKVVKQTTLPKVWVSTVWLGMNHRFGEGPPLIFETMVFANDGGYADLDCDRHSTEEDALRGHEEMVGKWSSIKYHEAVDSSG